MTPRDVGRARFYEAERLVHHMFDRAGSNRTVQLAGTELTLPVEARFASVDSVRDHVTRVLR
ncbi:MAG: TIGR04338 family metallohydrolase, partial [Actinomycetota bacterium]|nr:TIGR04338 family metallohydrolase [Actinomycetota bacterium]